MLTAKHSEEILNVKPIESTAPSWMRSALSHDQVIKWTKAKVRIFPTLSYAWESCQFLPKQTEDGKVNHPFLTKNYWASMENQLNSGGIFSQELHHCRFFSESRMICKNGTLDWNNLEIESSSCRCSTPSNGQEKETKRNVFQMQKKSRRT